MCELNGLMRVINTAGPRFPKMREGNGITSTWKNKTNSKVRFAVRDNGPVEFY